MTFDTIEKLLGKEMIVMKVIRKEPEDIDELIFSGEKTVPSER